MIFMTKDQKEKVFKKFVYQIRVKTRLIIQNSLTNDQNGQTAQKLKRVQNVKICCKVLKTA